MISLKLKNLEIDLDIRRLDTKVDYQVDNVLQNLDDKLINITSVQKVSFLRRVYHRLKKYIVVRKLVSALRLLKRKMKNYAIFRPIVKLSEKIFR